MDTLLSFSPGRMSQVDGKVPWSILQLRYLFVLTVTLSHMLQKASSVTGHVPDNIKINSLLLF